MKVSRAKSSKTKLRRQILEDESDEQQEVVPPIKPVEVIQMQNKKGKAMR